MTMATTTTVSSHQSPAPLSAKELVAHPAFNTEWSLEPTKSGHCPVPVNHGPSSSPSSMKGSTSSSPKTTPNPQTTGDKFDLFYEIHGSGPVKLVWITGLAAYRTSWKRQTRYFAHDPARKDQFSCLVFDNRGIGKSGKPGVRYSTSQMAKDVVVLLRHVGWLRDGPSGSSDLPASTRDLHVIGVSMGGMIAQELGLLIPESISSLFLVSTAPRLVRTIPFVENLRQRINMFVPRDLDVQLHDTGDRLFSLEFLARPDREYDESSRPELNFGLNRDRFAAGELIKRMDKDGFTRKGFLLQAVAAGWHHKSAEQLKEMGDVVGRRRIVVMHGTADRMITFAHFEITKREFGEDGGVEYVAWQGDGHVLMWEKEREFNQMVERMVLERADLK